MILPHLMLVFSVCLDIFGNFIYVLCEILRSGLSNDIYYIGNLLFAYNVFHGNKDT